MLRVNLITKVVLGLAALGIGAIPSAVAVTLDLWLVSVSNNIQVFFLEDLDLSGKAPAEEVFRVSVIVPASDPSRECHFKFYLGTLPMPDMIAGETKGFPLAAGEHLELSNLDLTSSGPYSFDSYHVSDEAEAIEDAILSTGYFPSDVYKMRLELFQGSNPVPLAWDEISITITNPFTIQLISPSGTPGFPALLNNSTPTFAWASPANAFLLKLCELTQPGMDPESVLEGDPLYETNPSDSLTTQNFVYPASGVQPLEAGHTYYWQVTSLVETSSGLMQYFSPIGAFSLAAQQNPDLQRIINAVQQIVGPGNASVLNPLVGYLPNGSLRLNGDVITIEELEALVPEFQSSNCTTTFIGVE